MTSTRPSVARSAALSPASRRRTSWIARIDTSTWSSVGSRVVSRWSRAPEGEKEAFSAELAKADAALEKIVPDAIAAGDEAGAATAAFTLGFLRYAAAESQ